MATRFLRMNTESGNFWAHHSLSRSRLSHYQYFNFSFQTLSEYRMCEKLFSGVRYWALEIKTNFLLSHTSFRGLQTTWCTIFRDCLRNFAPFCRNSFINLPQSLARSFFRGLLSAVPARQELGCLTSFTRKNTCIENTSHSEQSR